MSDEKRIEKKMGWTKDKYLMRWIFVGWIAMINTPIFVHRTCGQSQQVGAKNLDTW